MRLLGASDSSAHLSKWFALFILPVGLAGPWASALPVMEDEDSPQTPLSTTRDPSPRLTPATEVPSSFEPQPPNDAEPCTASLDQGAFPDAFLHSNNMRRLIGELATCRDDLFTLRVGDMSMLDSSDRVVVNKSHWRSCREALFTLIRWLEDKRTERKRSKCATETPTVTIPWGRTRRAYPPPFKQTWEAVDQVAHEDSEKPVDTDDSLYRARCKKGVCNFPDLQGLCSQDARQLGQWDARLCAMCYPPNDDLIERHCAGDIRPDGEVYFFLIGLLLTFVGAAATLVWLRHWRELRRIRRDDIMGEPVGARMNARNMYKSGWRKWDPRDCEFLQDIFRRLFRSKPKTIDLEDWPLETNMVKGNMGYSQRITQHNGQPYSRIPVMPKARSSGFQTPVESGTGLHQRWASADGRIGTGTQVPGSLPVRSSISRRYGSSP